MSTPRRRTPVVALVAGLLVTLALPAALAAPSAAAPVERSGARCEPSPSARTTGRGPDGASYTEGQVDRIDRDLEQALAARRATSSTTARSRLSLRIAVHVHVVASDTVRGPSRKRVQRQMEVLDDAYDGGQSADNARTRFSFYLASFERVRNTRWHGATIGGKADLEMRRKLHTGGPDDLNVYVLEPRERDGNTVLGWSSAPWDVRRLRLDGVTVHQGSVPGGNLFGYDRGDTLVHEVGHWLGLFHTFEGGCTEQNDLVEDTPAQGEPSTTCEGDKDTCELPGLDPVHNFLDYAIDACMNMFTPGQVSRMTDNWLAYRTP